jgi:hypothetical protein
MISRSTRFLQDAALLAGFLILNVPAHGQGGGNGPPPDSDMPPLADGPDPDATPIGQPNRPRPLQPEDQIDQGQPDQGAGMNGGGTTTQTLGPVSPVVKQSKVTVSQLGTAEGQAVGLLDETNGGMSTQMWSGADRAQLEDQLSKIPIVTTDPVLRELSRRLLLTRADPPSGNSHHALITIRLKRLLEGGLIDEAGELASQAAVPQDPEFDRVQAEALLYAQRPDVCSDKTKARFSEDDTFWLELRTYCFVASGDQPSADLTSSVIEAQGTNDTGFSTLMDDVQNSQALPVGQIQHPTAVDIYLMRKIGLPVTPAVASQLGTAANVIAALDPKNSPIERLSAADHIVRTGALGASELESIADAQVFSDAQKSDALGRGAMPFLQRQALIRQADALETRPAAKLSLLTRADPTMNEEGSFHVFAELQAPKFASALPSPTAKPGAWIAGRALIAGGAPQAAAAWLSAADNPLTMQAVLALAIDASGPDANVRAQKALVWFDQHPDYQTHGWPASTHLAIGLAKPLGLGDGVPPTPPPRGARDEDAPPVAPIVPSPSEGQELDKSTIDRITQAAMDPTRHGEAVLLILNAIGAKGPARFAPDADVFFVSTLKKLGLDRSARKLAVECLLLGPPPPPKVPTLPPPAAAAHP